MTQSKEWGFREAVIGMAVIIMGIVWLTVMPIWVSVINFISIAAYFTFKKYFKKHEIITIVLMLVNLTISGYALINGLNNNGFPISWKWGIIPTYNG